MPTSKRWSTPMPGSALRDGKLYLFGTKRIDILGPSWPDPRAWTKTESAPWRGHRPLLPRRFLVASGAPDAGAAIPPGRVEVFAAAPAESRAGRLRSAWSGWWRQVPREHRTTLAGFERATWDLWDLLNLLARDPLAHDLAQSSPALAVAVASNRAFRRPRPSKPRRAARRLTRLRQRDALAWLGFDGSGSTASLVRRMPARSATTPLVLTLRERLSDPAARRLMAHHAASIDPAVLDLLNPSLRPFVGPGLVEQVSTEAAAPRRAAPARLLRDLLRMAVALPGRLDVPRLRDIEHLEEVHDTAVRTLHRSRWTAPAANFGPPPVPGTSWLAPLSSTAALDSEGWEMGHCVGTYARAVAEGRSYIYRVSGWGLERATLELERSGRGWQIAQLLGRDNHPVGERTWRMVRQHLRSPTPAARPTWGAAGLEQPQPGRDA